MSRTQGKYEDNFYSRLKRCWDHVKKRLGDDSDCTTGPPYPHQEWPVSEQQRKLDASVTPQQAAIDVRREREWRENEGKTWPQPDGFINDYD